MSKLIQETKAGRVSLLAYKRVQKSYAQAMVEALKRNDSEAYNDAKMGHSFASLFVNNYFKINPKV